MFKNILYFYIYILVGLLIYSYIYNSIKDGIYMYVFIILFWPFAIFLIYLLFMSFACDDPRSDFCKKSKLYGLYMPIIIFLIIEILINYKMIINKISK